MKQALAEGQETRGSSRLKSVVLQQRQRLQTPRRRTQAPTYDTCTLCPASHMCCALQPTRIAHSHATRCGCGKQSQPCNTVWDSGWQTFSPVPSPEIRKRTSFNAWPGSVPQVQLSHQRRQKSIPRPHTRIVLHTAAAAAQHTAERFAHGSLMAAHPICQSRPPSPLCLQVPLAPWCGVRRCLAGDGVWYGCSICNDVGPQHP